jgi:hypothetical protein
MTNKKKNTLWRWWAKSLGEKASKCDNESDRIAIIRTIIFATYLITNCFIVAGVIRHWNDEQTINLYYLKQPHEIQSPVPETEEKANLF